ncbi:hypothetical protein BBP40_007824 [Aspergillus hancockii]|nr:hypothetical protein BBP40_007824 [Aspergillus hancockii]
MPSSLKRLAADHAALHSDLPPNYLFPVEDANDDLTQLTTLLAGPQGTPYSQGLWRVHLKMPADYPKSPPKATFKTRIWHPNVEESTGVVCVDTLKRDWKATLTLKDVLVVRLPSNISPTISCLLIYPNPDSALNSTAGALLQENYEAFARQAKLMTSIHALVPVDLKSAVAEAKTKGEDAGTTIPEQEEPRLLRSRKGTKVQSVTMKKNGRKNGRPQQPDTKNRASEQQPENNHYETDIAVSDDESECTSNASKENDPSLSPAPVRFAPPSPRKNAHGKRPLSVLTLPIDTEPFDMDSDDSDIDGMTASEKNIAANYHSDVPHRTSTPQRKSPKLSVRCKGVNSSGRIREEVTIFEDAPEPDCHQSGDGKENHGSTMMDFEAEPRILLFL